MKVVGFTFIRNAIKYDYPVTEAIRSILPLCSEVVVAVGNSDDNTLELIRQIDQDKIRIIETVWDDSLRTGGSVLAEETNKAFAAVPADADWAVYIQGDEVIHEKYLPTIQAAMERWKSDKQVDGLLLNYLHFFGSYDYVGDAYNWYRREIRIVRSTKNIYSYKDAQGFRKDDNKKLSVKLVDAWVYHYGWVRPPKVMQQKHYDTRKFYRDDEWIAQNLSKQEEFDYSSVHSLARFTDTHPQLMQERIKRINWKFDRDPSYNRLEAKDHFRRIVERLTGYRIFEYRNYKII
jgi:glycosyltransferase involved in cell wall biosynthesis